MLSSADSSILMLGIALVLIVVVVLYSAIERVPNGHRHALLVGDEYRRTLGPGYHLILPFLSRTFCLEGNYPLPVLTAEIVNGDDQLVLGTTVEWRITDAEAAFTEADDPRRAIHDAVLELRQELVRSIGIDELRRNLPEVEGRLERSLEVEAGRWGVSIDCVDLELRADDADVLETIRIGTSPERDKELSRE